MNKKHSETQTQCRGYRSKIAMVAYSDCDTRHKSRKSSSDDIVFPNQQCEVPQIPRGYHRIFEQACAPYF